MSVNRNYNSLYFENPIVILDTTDSVNSTTGSLVLYGGLSVGATTNFSGIMKITNNTTSTDVSTGALVLSGGIGTDDNLNVGGNAYIQGSLTAGSFAVTNLNAGTITVSNLLGTNATLASLFATDITTATLRASTLVSSANIVANVVTTGTVIASTVGTSWLSATTITGSNISLSGNLTVAGTLVAVNITTTNLMDTNLTAGIVNITNTLSANGTSNTIGSIFTTGGNVGIGTTSPSSKLTVNGEIYNTADGSGIKFYIGRIYKKGNGGLQIVSGFGDTVFRNYTDTATTMSINEAGTLSVTQLVTCGNIAANIITTGTLNAATLVSSANITNVNFTSTNILNTNITTSSLRYTNAIGTNQTLTSLFITDITSATLLATTGITTSNIYVSSDSAGLNLFGGARILKQSGDGMYIIPHNDGNLGDGIGGIKFRNAANSSTTMQVFGDGTLRVAGIVSAANMATNIITTGTLNATTLISSANITANIITTGTLNATTLISSANITANLITTGRLIANTVDLTPSVGDISTERWTYLANNTNGTVSGLAFDNNIVRSFNSYAHIEIQRSTGGNLYANYELKGVQLNSNWALNQSFVGDNTGIIFGINSTGQVYYTSSNIFNYSLSTIHYRASITSTTSGILI